MKLYRIIGITSNKDKETVLIELENSPKNIVLMKREFDEIMTDELSLNGLRGYYTPCEAFKPHNARETSLVMSKVIARRLQDLTANRIHIMLDYKDNDTIVSICHNGSSELTKQIEDEYKYYPICILNSRIYSKSAEELNRDTSRKFHEILDI